ncbi:MAG TPA: RsmG family class I SAM-dependent methyltransferase [Acidimicrobiales bacterium]|nr:RsmG family class I SAM-dependent methyltransferase [Acidimicrobiales bacterium]
MRALASARALGLLGPGPLEEHVASAQGFYSAIVGFGAQPPGVDIGSGGGVPGLLLASWLPDWKWTLIDAQRRRTSFLAAQVAALGLAGRVRVVRARTEELAHEAEWRGQAGTVTARSFGPPPATAEAGAPLLRPGGCLIVAEPPASSDRWPEDVPSLGLRLARRVESPRRVVVLEQTGVPAPEFPRPIERQRSAPVW